MYLKELNAISLAEFGLLAYWHESQYKFLKLL